MSGMHPVLVTLIFSMIIQLFFFAFAVTLKTDKVTDLSYGLTFIIIAIYWAVRNSENIGSFEIILAALVVIWGIRIVSYLFVRIIKTGKDRRFDDKRDNFVKFGAFWTLQGLSVWVIMIPSVYLLTREQPADINSWAFLGFFIWISGLLIETIADLQLYKFRFSKNNIGKWIDEGLWSYSRHPNYFGEMLVWWGIFIFGIGVYQGLGWMSIIGPIFITVLLRYISGVPLLEKSNDKRWGKDKDYVTYKKSTNLIVLGFKKS